MKKIPMKVQTKMLAFSDSAAIANDRLSGETSIIAFRATALKGGFKAQAPGLGNSPGN